MFGSKNSESQPINMRVEKTPDGKFKVSSRNHPEIPPQVDLHQQTAVSKLISAVNSAPSKEPTVL